MPDAVSLHGLLLPIRKAFARYANIRPHRLLPAAADPARRIFDRAWENGLVIRAFSHGVLGYAPPLCCTADEIDAIVERTEATLDQTLADPDVRAALA